MNQPDFERMLDWALPDLKKLLRPRDLWANLVKYGVMDSSTVEELQVGLYFKITIVIHIKVIISMMSSIDWYDKYMEMTIGYRYYADDYWSGLHGLLI